MRQKKSMVWTGKAILIGLLFLLPLSSSGCRMGEVSNCGALIQFVKESFSAMLERLDNPKCFIHLSEEERLEEDSEENRSDSTEEREENRHEESSENESSHAESSRAEPSKTENSEPVHSEPEESEKESGNQDSEAHREEDIFSEDDRSEMSEADSGRPSYSNTDTEENSTMESEKSSTQPGTSSDIQMSREPEISIHQHHFIEKKIVTADAWEEVIFQTIRYAVIRCKECGVEFSAASDPEASLMDGVYYSQQMDEAFKLFHCTEEHNPQHWYDFYIQREEVPVERIWHEEEYRILQQCECGETME